MRFLIGLSTISVPTRFFLVGIVFVASSLTVQAQRYRRGYGPPFIGPVIPGPFFGPIATAPPLPSQPSGVRVQTPFFSLNVRPDSALPPRYYSYGYSSRSYRPAYRYGYEYSHIHPAYPLNYRTPESYYYAPFGVELDYRGLSPSYLETLPHEPLAAQPFEVPSYELPSDENPHPRFSLVSLRQSAALLYQKLAELGEEGEIWNDYLKPDRVADAAQSEAMDADIIELSKRYESITRNPDLSWMRSMAGFDSTHRMLQEWVDYYQATTVVPNMDVKMLKPALPISPAASDEVPKDGTDTADVPKLGEEILPEPIPTPSQVEPL
ncbi:hypothetical protein [Roseiconus lacunae]|uniref:Uncharacterized protein n=1 Tax=Roseiconus lacunae TaxID=2605694 RepID=A0ABT7PDH8_9BACT|nr:hypothetical protein [Roseiconus lacunae]MDM4014549.1 hypothetical protein [Roseiconus lacunae]